MNSAQPAAVGLPEQAGQPEIRQQMESWRELLVRCGRKPGRRSVHALRVATLRLQAEVDFRLSGLEPGSARALRRWRKHGNKLRRSLAPLRQADVFLVRLARLRSRSAAANGHLKCPPECLGVLGELERSLKRKRDGSAKRLGDEIEARRRRLERLGWKVERALAVAAPRGEGGSSRAIAGQIAELLGEFGELNEETLHAFRKRIKKVRYLAEIVARTDPAVARYAAALKRMTAAIGDWHDCQALAAEAAHAHRRDGNPAPLADFLYAQAGQALAKALTVCRRSMAQLLAPAVNGKGPQAVPPGGLAERVPRKPAVSVPAEFHGAVTEKLLTEPERSLRAS